MEAGKVAHRPRAVLPPLQSWETRSLHPTSQLRRPPPRDPQAPTGPQDNTEGPAPGDRRAAKRPPGGARPAEPHQAAGAGGEHRAGRCLGRSPCFLHPTWRWHSSRCLGPAGHSGGRGAATGPPEAGAEESQRVQAGRPREGGTRSRGWHHAPQLQSPPSHAQQRALPVPGPEAPAPCSPRRPGRQPALPSLACPPRSQPLAAAQTLPPCVSA